MAKGKISWVNPPENKGKITRTDVTSSIQYEYNINAGDTVNGYVPQMDDVVDFEADDSSQRARMVQLAVAQGKIVSFDRSPLDPSVLEWVTANADYAEIDVFGEVSVPVGTHPVGRNPGPFTLSVKTNRNDSTFSDSKTIS